MLRDYQRYYNKHRNHMGRRGPTPIQYDGITVVNIDIDRWKKRCRRLFQLPVAA